MLNGSITFVAVHSLPTVFTFAFKWLVASSVDTTYLKQQYPENCLAGVKYKRECKVITWKLDAFVAPRAGPS